MTENPITIREKGQKNRVSNRCHHGVKMINLGVIFREKNKNEKKMLINEGIFEYSKKCSKMYLQSDMNVL